MCAVNAKFIYVTGGVFSGEINTRFGRGRLSVGGAVANCHRYDIDQNKWQEMKSMQQPRERHSSCQLTSHIYVFCGLNNRNAKINSVEKLSIVADPNLQV